MKPVRSSTSITENRRESPRDGGAPGTGRETASGAFPGGGLLWLSTGLRAVAALVFALLAVTAAAHALEDDCADIPAFCRWDVRRAEEAYREGLRLAETEEARDEARRVRVASLRFIVETTFESVLSWLSNREDLARALEDDQAMWLRGLTALPDDNREDLDRIANTLKNRLRVFGTITGDNFCPDPGGC